MVKFNTEKDGLRPILKDYQEVALKYLWRLDGDGASSREVWVNVNKVMSTDTSQRDSISRASIINFLNKMVDEGALNNAEITGKGGHRGIYSAKHDEAGFKEHMAKKIISKMLETWPEATRDAIKAIEEECARA